MSACGRFRELRPRDYCFRGQRGCSAALTGGRHCANSAGSSIGWPSRSVHRRTLKGGIHLLRSQAPLRAVSWNWAVECGSGSRERERAARRSSNTKMGRRKPVGLGRPSPAGVAVGGGMLRIGRSGSASRMVGVGLETKKGDRGAPNGDGLQRRESLVSGDGNTSWEVPPVAT